MIANSDRTPPTSPTATPSRLRGTAASLRDSASVRGFYETFAASRPTVHAGAATSPSASRNQVHRRRMNRVERERRSGAGRDPEASTDGLDAITPTD
jgi:hypothetical protein